MAKTLDQKIADAEARLARLRLETRKQDTGRKIVLGGILLSAAEHDPAIREWLLKQVDGDKLRKVDAERLAPLIAKWREMTCPPSSAPAHCVGTMTI